jgi:hypothetical protein
VSTASLVPSVSIDPRAATSVPRGPSRPSFLAFESVALPARPIGIERLTATADARLYEQAACQARFGDNAAIRIFRIVFGNVTRDDSRVDNLRVVCVADPPTDERSRGCVAAVVVDDTCAGSARRASIMDAC